MKRHALSTRLWHWANFACLAVMFMSGLNISTAHPWLYWGERGFLPQEAWLAVTRFPGWATIPGHYSLADARDWHLAIAWPFEFIMNALLTPALSLAAAQRATWRAARYAALPMFVGDWP